MLNAILKKITGKDLIVINRHRNSSPLLNDTNRRRFLFINYIYFWKATRIFGRNNRLRYRAMAAILSFLGPVYIIDINWTAKLNRLYYVWCRNNRPSRFIVVQHGLYIGGIITDNAHKYSKCDIILCWGEHSIKEFVRYNSGKNVRLVKWGNPLYNLYDRSALSFKDSIGNKVLVAPTVLVGKRKIIFEDFMRRLQALGFEITVKEHSYQKHLSAPIDGFSKVTGDLFEILKDGKYDMVVSDTSTCLIDSIFFKNRTLYFSPEGDISEYRNNAYSRRLENLADEYMNWTSRDDVLSHIDIAGQEALLDDIVFEGDNDLACLPSI